MNLFLHIFYAVHFVFWKMGLYISIVKQRQKNPPTISVGGSLFIPRYPLSSLSC